MLRLIDLTYFQASSLCDNFKTSYVTVNQARIKYCNSRINISKHLMLRLIIEITSKITGINTISKHLMLRLIMAQ